MEFVKEGVCSYRLLPGATMATSNDFLSMLGACLSALGQGQVPDSAILTFLLSKALGYGILVSGAVVKVPQILAVARSKSAEGLAIMSFELENICFIIHASYGYLYHLPINSYGEAVFMLAQNTVLLGYLYRYSRAPWARVLAFVVLNVSMIWAVLSGRVSTAQAQSAYNMNNLIVTAARVPQIMKNYKAKNTGQLSTVAFAANSLGCIARIFTSYQDNAGIAMIRGFVLGLGLNATILGQILFYGRRGQAAKATGKTD